MIKFFNFGKRDVHLGSFFGLARRQEFGQAVQGLGSKHHVHIGRAFDDVGAFLAGHAAAHTNEHAARFEVLDTA